MCNIYKRKIDSLIMENSYGISSVQRKSDMTAAIRLDLSLLPNIVALSLYVLKVLLCQERVSSKYTLLPHMCGRCSSAAANKGYMSTVAQTYTLSLNSQTVYSVSSQHKGFQPKPKQCRA